MAMNCKITRISEDEDPGKFEYVPPSAKETELR
jgi:hypothetical protein